jgi:mannose-6-phosphate isomerase-like protein (cupin superfamily)
MVRVISREDRARDKGWNGGWNGEEAGTTVSFIFTEVTEPDRGPRLHAHAYDELQIVRRGEAWFQVGDEKIVAGEGDILVIPAGTPHKVRSRGEMTDVISVHLNGRMVADWLE